MIKTLQRGSGALLDISSMLMMKIRKLWTITRDDVGDDDYDDEMLQDHVGDLDSHVSYLSLGADSEELSLSACYD